MNTKIDIFITQLTNIMNMECPKCAGGTYLCDEELVQVIENSDPMKIIIKATYICKACAEKFSRLVCENLEAKKREKFETSNSTTRKTVTEQVEGLKFF